MDRIAGALGASRFFFVPLGVAMLAGHARAQLWEVCEPLYTLVGESTGDQFGWTGTNAGDVDGNGANDFLITAPFFGAQNQGKLYVYAGETGAEIRTVVGAPGSNLSYMASIAGDVDMDGTPDYIVGAPYLNNSAPGSAFVYSGVDGTLLHTFGGEMNGDQFGKNVGPAGDVNGDGYDDLLIGAPMADPNGLSSGRCYVYCGDTGNVLLTMDGASAGDQFGSGAHRINDIDNDGTQDLLVGASGAGAGGEAYVLSGADGSRMCTLQADATGQSFGLYFLGPVGDVNADGTEDFFVSDFGNAALGGGTGRSYVYSGVDCSLIHTLTGEAAGDGFGIGRGWAGDYDRDGHDDIALGHWVNDDGAPNAGKLSVLSGKDGSVLAHFTGDVAGANLGFDFAGVGDIDGDGVMDFLGTAATANGARGVVYAISGRPAPPRNYCESQPNSTGVAATIDYRKYTSLARNDFELNAAGAPVNALGIFFYGPNEAAVPFQDGTLCVSGGFFRLPSVQVSQAGTATLALDFTQPPFSGGPGSISPGDTRHFQFWFRDPGGPGGTGSNLSDGMRVTFCP